MKQIDRLLSIMAKLRDPQQGCPWDRAQTFASVAIYTIDEAYEVADAIQRGDRRDLCEELGDLLLNIVFHARMAAEAGDFDFDDVVISICDKMVRRHPHVFADEQPADGDLQASWERHKAAERAAKNQGDTSVLAGVALALPALMRAQKLAQRASRVGFDWQTTAAVVAKIREELGECEDAQTETPARLEEEVGDLLFAVTNLARHTKVDAEQALRKANDKFQARFEHMEQIARQRGCDLGDCSAGELDQYWQIAKREA